MLLLSKRNIIMVLVCLAIGSVGILFASASTQRQQKQNTISKKPKMTVKKSDGRKSPNSNDTARQEAVPDLLAEFEEELRQLEIKMSRKVEKELIGWKPSKQNDQTPMETILHTDTSLKGTWAYSTGFDSASLRFGTPDKGGYPVHFRTSGCTERWRLQRTARYEKGMITLNRPVKTYMNYIYQRLYTVQVGEQTYLIPDILVADFQKGLSDDGKTVNEKLIGDFAFAFKPDAK